jgi:hypothetical protein
MEREVPDTVGFSAAPVADARVAVAWEVDRALALNAAPVPSAVSGNADTATEIGATTSDIVRYGADPEQVADFVPVAPAVASARVLTSRTIVGLVPAADSCRSVIPVGGV